MLTFFILAISFVGLLVVVVLTTSANREATTVSADINRFKQEESSVLKDAKEVVGSMSPQTQQALKAAHQLVDRKEFSWSRLFADLESSLPGTVRVSRIAVRNVSKKGDETVAELELGVFAKSATIITDMISSMNKGGVFEAQLLSQQLQKGRGESGTTYELLVIYRPRAGFTPQNVAKLETDDTAKEERR
ncbi:MAG: hypothetical protein C5B55_00700 [Blastocatellia bacterium]|nr:MAG: hypothetical protein C5B55_00700 [Blastocatellia bacterium]